MMVKPRDDLKFGVCGNVESFGPALTKSRETTLICLEFEANRNVSMRKAKQGREWGRGTA
jgi:hypothetical protein